MVAVAAAAAVAATATAAGATTGAGALGGGKGVTAMGCRCSSRKLLGQSSCRARFNTCSLPVPPAPVLPMCSYGGGYGDRDRGREVR